MSAINNFLQHSGSLRERSIKMMVQTRQSFLLAILALLLAIALVVFAILPQIQEIIVLRGEVSQKQEELTKLQKKVDTLVQLQDFVQTEQVQKVNIILPSDKPLLQLLAATQFTASSSGVGISDVVTTPGRLASISGQLASGSGNLNPDANTVLTPQTTPDLVGAGQRLANGADPLSISLKATGTLSQINDFLSKAEKQTPFTNITSFKLDPSTITSATPIAEPLYLAEIVLSTYSYTKPILVSLDSPVPDIGQTEQTFLSRLDDFSYAKISLPTQVIGGGLQDLFGVSQATPATDTPVVGQ